MPLWLQNIIFFDNFPEKQLTTFAIPDILLKMRIHRGSSKRFGVQQVNIPAEQVWSALNCKTHAYRAVQVRS